MKHETISLLPSMLSRHARAAQSNVEKDKEEEIVERRSTARNYAEAEGTTRGRLSLTRR